VIVGSYVPQGVAVGEWVIATATGPAAFYDIDTPVTLAKLDRGDTQYLSRALVMRYDLYLSFTGGPTLDRLEKKYYSPRARVLYCSVDTLNYFPEPAACQWDLGYLGTYSEDRQPALEQFMLSPAAAWPTGRFVSQDRYIRTRSAGPPTLPASITSLPPRTGVSIIPSASRST
jgi:Uncharacterized protein conserved in bacteria